MSLYLHGVGHFHPDNVIDNALLEELDIGTTDAWITERVGIKTRRTVLSLDYIRQTKNVDPRAAREASICDHAELGARAARMALERAGLSPADIGLTVAGGTVPDHVTPSEACMIAARLGIDAPAFDMVSACTSFLVPMHFLSMLDPARAPRFILVVVPETVTCAVDYRDRNTAVLLGHVLDDEAERTDVVSRRQHVVVPKIDLMLAGSDLVMGRLHLEAHGFEREDDLAPHVLAHVHRA